MIRSLPLAIAVLGGLAAAQWPAKAEAGPVALVGGSVHTVSGPVLERATVVFERGKITAVGTGVPLPAGCRTIDVSGKRVYPALIAAGSLLGLTEIEAVRATRDFAEVGGVTPEVRAQVSFHPDSALLPVTRRNGVALALAVPQAGLVAGTSALMMLDGWTWEEMTVRAPVGLHVRWPAMAVKGDDAEERAKALRERDQALALLRETFAQARAYAQALAAEQPGRHDRRLEAMRGVFDGSLRVFVHADELRQIQAALDWARQENLSIVLVGGLDAWRVAPELVARRVPVIVAGVHRLPLRPSDDHDAAFTLPRKLQAAGVEFCIAGNGTSMEAPHERNLPYQAATAAAYGLPRLEALRAVTLYAARILGVGDRLGSIEVGKDATLIVTDGDPLEVRSNVELEFIEGRAIDLDNRHEQLWRKYTEKYRRLGLLDK